MRIYWKVDNSRIQQTLQRQFCLTRIFHRKVTLRPRMIRRYAHFTYAYVVTKMIRGWGQYGSRNYYAKIIPHSCVYSRKGGLLFFYSLGHVHIDNTTFLYFSKWWYFLEYVHIENITLLFFSECCYSLEHVHIDNTTFCTFLICAFRLSMCTLISQLFVLF